MSKIHILKTSEKWFREVWGRNKSFDIRLNDRDFQLADRLVLIEFNNRGDYTGRVIEAVVTLIIFAGDADEFPALKDDYCVMNIKEMFRINSDEAKSDWYIDWHLNQRRYEENLERLKAERLGNE